MIEEAADGRDLDVANGSDGVGEVLPILAAAAVRTEGRSRKGEHTRDAGGLHSGHRVRKVGVPVPVAPVERQVDVVGREIGGDGGEKLSAMGVDGAHPVEMVVVLGHLEHPLWGDVTPAQDVLQEGDYVLPLLGSAEANEQKCIKLLICHILLKGMLECRFGS